MLNAIYYALNAYATNFRKRNADTIYADVAQSCAAAAHKVLVKLIRAGIYQPECKRTERRKEGARGRRRILYPPQRLREQKGREPEAEIQKHMGEIAYVEPEDYLHVGDRLPGRDIYAQNA